MAKIEKMQEVAVDILKPYARNAKLHTDEQVERVAESIRRFGFVQPIVAERDGTVIIGHCRLEAAKQLGLEKVPVIFKSDLTEDECKALRLADNKTNESEWDDSLVQSEIESIEGIDMSDFGFESVNIEFAAFDGDGDGGGSYISTGSKVRVVIGSSMFDIEDNNHLLYDASRKIDVEKAKAKIAEMLSAGELE